MLLVEYHGGDKWHLTDKLGNDNKENWEEVKELNDPIYRTIKPIEIPK